ncbi:MAG: hypothetical protein RL136_2438 [Planctomycetota bacterium]|jgi:sugar lactone lactonase YvrE
MNARGFATISTILAIAPAGIVPAAQDALEACTRGAEPLVTISEVRGACAVAFDGAAILACAPEQAGDADNRQIVRAIPVPGQGAAPRVEALPTDAKCAVDLAISPGGTVAIADAAGAVHLVERGGARRSIGADVLEAPSGVAWRRGELLVSDRRAHAVVVLSPEGVERARLGVGALREPLGIAVDSEGTVFVADRVADCIWRFDADMVDRASGVSAAAPARLGERGSNPGQLRSPRDVIVRETRGSKCLLIADELNHRIQSLTTDGAFVGFFGMHALVPRQGDGRIHYPVSLALAADNTTLAVAEAFEDRIQVFRLTAVPDEIDPAATSPDFISSHFGAESACGDDMLALVDVETQGVAILDARRTPPIHISIIGGVGATPGRFIDIGAVAIEPGRARVWIADGGRARIDAYDTEWDREKSTNVDMFIPRLARSIDLAAFARRLQPSESGAPWRVPAPTDIAFEDTPAGRVLLLDDANLAVIAADRGMRGGECWPLPSEARMPVELAVASDGRIAVADPVASRVFLRGTAGAWDSLDGLGGRAFVRPSGVAFDENGRLVVADSALDACVIEPAAGAEGPRIVGERGVLDEQFFDPQSIVHSPLGMIVVDRGNHRFQRFGDGFSWNLTGSLGRYYDRKRRGSPGGPPRLAPPPASAGTAGAKGDGA